MVKAYWRCNGGDYFSSKCCPFDGWSSPEINELFEAAQKLNSQKIPLSVAAFRNIGVNEKAIRRCIVVDFGDEAAAFDALTPELYDVNGKAYKLHEVGNQFK